MPLKLGSAFVEITGEDSKLDAAFSRARGKTTAFGSVLQGILQGVGQRLFDGIVRGAEFFIDKIGESIVASSNLTEAINKTGVVFGSSADEMMAWSETSADALGMSKRLALDAAAGFGALFIQMGQGRPVAAEMSQELVQLAADLSSIYNIPMAAALEKIRAGLAGEIEPLRSVNIFLNDNLVKNKAVALGLAATTEAVDDAAKVEARRILILEQGSIAMGDFARTSREFANGQKILAAEMEDGAARLGAAFRPAAAAIQNTLIDLAPQMFAYAENITNQFANGLAAGIRAIIPIITTIRQLFTYWFAPGSPPRILPDIDVWGRGTMQAWLDGMATVDVKKAFDTVGRAVEGVLRSFMGAGKMDEGGLVGSIFGSRDAIAKAVDEFRRLGSVSEATIKKIASAAGPAGAAISTLVRTYFDLQRASEKVKQAQDALNRTTEEYDAIINPLRGKLDEVRGQQQALANQQRLIAAKNTLNNIDSTASEKRDAALEIEAIALEEQIRLAEDKKDAATEAGQADVDTATKEEEAAKLQLEAAQATIDRQVETNNLLAEQKRLVEQLAAAQEAAAAKAQADAEATANKATQAAEKAQREAEQLQAAQLRYNLEIADTPGKIALMEAELAKLTPGTADYFDTLTRISQLQEQYKNELEQTAKAAGALGLTDIGPGLDTGIIQPLDEMFKAGEGGVNLAKAIEDAFAPIGPAGENVKKLADAIKDMVLTTGTILGIDLTPFFEKSSPSAAGTEWDKYGILAEANAAKVQQSAEASAKSMEESVAATTLTLQTLQSNYKVIQALMNGDWAAFWIAWEENRRLGQEASNANANTGLETLKGMFARAGEFWALVGVLIGNKLSEISTAFRDWVFETQGIIDGWATNLTTTIDTWGEGLFDSGAAALDNFFKGLQSKWTEIQTWFTSSLAGLRAQLPFSEPKDPSSPLRGLGKSGESMINMIQDGMEKASLNVNSLAGNLLPATAGATTNNSTSYGPVTINLSIEGGATPSAIGQVENKILSALRSAGVTA